MMVVLISAALLVGFCASMALGSALGRSAKRADECAPDVPELAEIAADLTELSDLRSPSGRRFFPTLQARRELAEILHETLGSQPR